ncbi:hypothetical protein BDN67DRAFT_910983 [Paxillus ammoniavirescens]|nr:hypothetical protein BDN67DRAFT_910983 [Paxillus ammoniavirescens]
MWYSIVPLITLDGIIAYNIVNSSLNSECFLKFIKDHIVNAIHKPLGPRSVLIMDNCHIHDSE